MYRSVNWNSKTKKCFCPNCHQFGTAATGVLVEGKTKSRVPIMLCSYCGEVEKKKVRKDSPGQKTLDFGE